VAHPAAATPAFVPVYSAFAAGYFLSYLFRTVNAVISPELTRELALAPASLGFLTSAYFLAFGLMQIPCGMLLDRYGPRRVEPALLVIAAAGALIFGLSEGLAGLTVGRAIIGAGVATCLMAPLKGLAMWYPPNRQASLGGWMMVAGGLGALAATTPLEFAVRFVGWRTIFLALAATTLCVALWIAWRVPDTPKPLHASDVRAQLRSVRGVLSHPRFWWIALLGGLGMGSFFAVQGLWAVPWMMEVEGLTRAEAASRLLGMGIASLAGYVFIGLFAAALDRRGIRTRHLFAAGFTLNALALAMITADLRAGPVWWWLYGLGASANVLAFSVLNAGFPRELAGRTNTAVNLMMFGGGFALQWGIGVVVDAAVALGAVERTTGLRWAFSLVLALDLAGLIWFFSGWRRFAYQPTA
jgi:predicted MFS family arabinose efflux permease